MITKWIQFTVRPDASAAFRAELVVLEKASLQESGCARYAAYQDADRPDVFTVLESWESSVAFEGHRDSPHVIAFKERCETMIPEKSARSLNPAAE